MKGDLTQDPCSRVGVQKIHLTSDFDRSTVVLSRGPTGLPGYVGPLITLTTKGTRSR